MSLFSVAWTGVSRHINRTQLLWWGGGGGGVFFVKMLLLHVNNTAKLLNFVEEEVPFFHYLVVLKVNVITAIGHHVATYSVYFAGQTLIGHEGIQHRVKHTHRNGEALCHRLQRHGGVGVEKLVEDFDAHLPKEVIDVGI